MHVSFLMHTLQVKRTCYAQSSQIRQIRKKMVEIMTREASSCDLKELVGKFIPEAIGELHSYKLLTFLGRADSCFGTPPGCILENTSR